MFRWNKEIPTNDKFHLFIEMKINLRIEEIETSEQMKWKSIRNYDIKMMTIPRVTFRYSLHYNMISSLKIGSMNAIEKERRKLRCVM